MDNQNQPLQESQQSSSLPRRSPDLVGTKAGSFLTNKLFLIILAILILFTFIYARAHLGLNSKSNQITKPTPTQATISQPSPTPIDETANWQTYRNEEFGFEVKYPAYFSVNGQTAQSLKLKSSRSEWLIFVVQPQALDAFQYWNPPGGIGFQYDAKQDIWKPLTSGAPQKYAPQKKQIGKLVYYFLPTGDAAVIGEKIFLESPQKKFIVTLELSRNESYRDCITPCPEAKPFSDSRTIDQILSTFKFTP